MAEPKKLIKIIILFLSIIFLTNASFAENRCFLAKENGKIIASEGECQMRHPPCSTFKIAISLMGYNEGILIDESHPELPFKKGYLAWHDSWKQSHNPLLWMKNSCLWYSQVITKKLGVSKFKEYLIKFHYGNQNISDNKCEGNGLTNAWLSSCGALQISPEEQTIFLQELLDNKLPASKKAHEMTRNILPKESLANGWELHGKTGHGYKFKNGIRLSDLQFGWFVGWAEKDGRTIIFASYIEDESKQSIPVIQRIKTDTKEKLRLIITEQ